MSNRDLDAPQREQRHIQSIEIGFRLIGVLEASRTKLPLKAIAERAGMPSSKAHLYMVSFIRLGLVVQDPVSTWYGLGPYAIQLGLAGMRQLDLLDVARSAMSVLQQTCGFSTHLSVWGNMGPAIVAKYDGDLEVPLAIKIGHILPLLTSATGRVFLALLPAAEVDPVLKTFKVSAAVVKEARRGAKQELETTGVARSDSKVFDGFAALSSPIFDLSGAISATITVLGLRSRLDLDSAGALATSLKETCQLVSRTLRGEQPVLPPGPASDGL